MKITPQRVQVCSLATSEHDAACRQYAHVFHKKGVICVSKQFRELPKTFKLGLLLHEVGHILAGSRASEANANKAVESASGVPIYYKDSPFGEQVEWIKPGDKAQATAFLEMVLVN